MPEETNVICSCQIPEALNAFLEGEAKRLFTSKSAVVRQILDRARKEQLVLQEKADGQDN